MKNFRKLGSMFTVSMLLFVFAFFMPKTALADSKKDHYPVKVITYGFEGQALEEVFEKAPERVLAFWQDNIETMLALGLEDKIILAAGLDHPVKDEYVEAFKKVEFQPKMPSKEVVLALDLDLIMGWKSTFSEKNLGDVPFWHERGAHTLIALNTILKPQTLENEFNNILNIGKIFNVEDKANAIVDNMKNKIEEAAKLSKNRKKVKAIIVEFEKKNGVYRVYGSKTIGGNVASLVGAELVGDLDKSLGTEDLIAANPDVIFTVYYGDAIAEDESIKSILDNPALSSINAVKNKRVHAMMLSEVWSSGIRSLDCIETIVNGLYPKN